MALDMNLMKIARGSQVVAAPPIGTTAVGTFTRETLFPNEFSDANGLPKGAHLGICIDTAAGLAALAAAADGAQWGVRATFRAYSNGDSATGTLIQTTEYSNVADLLSEAGLTALKTGAPNDGHYRNNELCGGLSPQIPFPPYYWDEVDIEIVLPVGGLTDVGVYAFSRSGTACP